MHVSIILVTVAVSANADTFLGPSLCQDVVFSNGVVEEVCYNTERDTPISTFMENGVAEQRGGFEFYYIYEAQYDGLRFRVSWEDEEDNACKAIVGIQECSSCDRCNLGDPSNNSIRVDCRNVPQGIATGCQTLAPDSLVFPLDPYRTSGRGSRFGTFGSTLRQESTGDSGFRGRARDAGQPTRWQASNTKSCGRLGCRGRGSS